MIFHRYDIGNYIMDLFETAQIQAFQGTVNSRYLEVVGTIFYKVKLPKVQINLHFG